MAALAEHPRAVGILELDRVMIEDFAVVLALAHLAAAHAVGPDRVAALEPVDDVQVVDVLLDDVVAAEPGEVVPVAHLVLHFAQLAAVLCSSSARVDPRGRAVPIDARGNDVADRAVLQPLDRFQIDFAW